MSVVPPDLDNLDSSVAPLPEDNYKISSRHSPTEGLAPKDMVQPTNKVVIAIAPAVSGEFLRWNLVKRCRDSRVFTFELGTGSNLFLSYDFATELVVLKNDSQPAWILTRNPGKQFEYKISPLTLFEKKYLTYDDKSGAVKVSEEIYDPDDLRQIWKFDYY